MKRASFRHSHRHLLIGLLAALAPLTLYADNGDEPWRQGETGSSPSSTTSPSSTPSTPSMPPSMPEDTPGAGSSGGQYDREMDPSSGTRGVQGPIRPDTDSPQSTDLPQSPDPTPEIQRRRELDDMMRRQEEERQRALPNRIIP